MLLKAQICLIVLAIFTGIISPLPSMAGKKSYFSKLLFHTARKNQSFLSMVCLLEKK